MDLEDVVDSNFEMMNSHKLKGKNVCLLERLLNINNSDRIIVCHLMELFHYKEIDYNDSKFTSVKRELLRDLFDTLNSKMTSKDIKSMMEKYNYFEVLNMWIMSLTYIDIKKGNRLYDKWYKMVY
jgi:hypothetical protein